MSVTEDHSPQVTASLNGTAPAMTHWQQIDELREQHRFFWNDEAQGYWVLTRYDDIREAFQTPGGVLQPLDHRRRTRIRRSASCRRSATRRSTWRTGGR